MTKKKGGATSNPKQQRGGGQLGAGQKDIGVDEPAADTVIQVINRRIRAAKKKLQKIGTIEEARAEGKEINDDQARTLESRIQVNAILEELLRIEPLVEKALKKEIEEAVAQTLSENGGKSTQEEDATNEEEDQEGEESSLESASPTGKEDRKEEASQLLDVLYVSQVFGFGGTEADYEGFLSEANAFEGSPVTRQQLEKLANLGKSLLMRSAQDGLTHQEALERCSNMALAFLRTPDATVDDETTVAEMVELVNHIKMSDFFRSMVIEPTPAPQIDPTPVAAAAHIESTRASAAPHVDPPLQQIGTTAAGAVVHAPELQEFNPPQNESHDAALEGNSVLPQGHTPHQSVTSGGSGGGPRPFLPFPSLPPMPLTAPQTISNPQSGPSHARVTPQMGFNSPMQGVTGYMNPNDFSNETNQQPVGAAGTMRVDHVTEEESEAASTPLVPSLLHTHEARQAHLDDKPAPGVHDQTMSQPPVNKSKPDEANVLDSGSRMPGRRSRGMDSSQGGSGPQGHSMGSQQNQGGQGSQSTNAGSSHNGGRGHSGKGGGAWHGYRGEGRGRGRGRGWDTGNSRGGRGQHSNGFPSRGSGRGNRGSYRGRGGPWRQSSQHSQPPQSAQS